MRKILITAILIVFGLFASILTLSLASTSKASPTSIIKYIDGKPQESNPSTPDKEALGQPTKKKGVYRFLSGTGFFVSKTKLVTNAHVVDNCKFIRIRGKGVKPSFVKIEAVDKDIDLALLSSDNITKRTARLRSQENLREKEKVVIIGYPLQNSVKGAYIVREGYIQNNDDPFFDNNKVIFSDVVEKGYSGGPLLDNYGSVIGVIMGKVSYYLTDASTGTKQENLKLLKSSSVAIDLKTLKRFLYKNKVFYREEAKHNINSEGIAERRNKNAVVNIHCIQN